MALLVILPELDQAFRAGAVTLTPGRLLLAVAGAAALADVARHRSLDVLKRPLVVTTLVAAVAALGLVLLSIGTNGCNCRGSAAGLTEFTATLTIASYVLSRDGRWAFWLLGAAGAGATLAAVLSVPELRSGLDTRITGPYGNPNNLGIVLASGVPIAIGGALHARRRTRTVLIAVALLLGVGTFFTYSREALLSLAAALIVFLVLRASARRTRLLIAVAALVLAGLGAVLYPSFERSRVQADLGSQAYLSNLASRLSGTDAESVGWISEGSARVIAAGHGLDVFTHAGEEGTSLGLGRAAPQVPITFSVRARSLAGPVSFSLALLDARNEAATPARRTIVLTSSWRRYALVWTPSEQSSDPRVFVYLNAAGSFQFDSPTIRRGRFGTAHGLTIAPISSARLRALGQRRETDDIHFREQMLLLAVRAFAHHPLRGIGWEQFPDYANAHSVYGHEGTQSEYGRYLAELGIGGVVVLLVLASAAILGLRRRTPFRDVVASVLTVWLVGLLFDSALETISMSAILALGLAVACTRPDHAATPRSLDVGRARGRATATPVPRSGDYRPALDGVRAVAIVAVVGYHLHTRLRGGFLGVDVFFVLSGYLITSMLLREHSRTGRINPLRFWGRRARRLLPAVLALVLVVALWTAHHDAILTFPARRADILSTVFYFANWHFIAVQQSYFALFVSGVSPLEHMWSLAIEEQFYLLWPLVLTALLVLVRRDRRLFVSLLIAAAIASAALMALLYQPQNPTRAYFGTDTRAFELLVGAALAVVLSARPAMLARPGVARAANGLWPLLVAVIMIAFLEMRDQSSLYFRGGALAFSVIVAAGIGFLEVQPRSLLAQALSAAPIRWLGTVSYSLYLWHWPIIVWTAGRALTWPHAVKDAVQAALALGVATISFYGLEHPIRYGQIPGLRRSPARLALVLGAAVIAVIAVSVHSTSLPAHAHLVEQLTSPVEQPCPPGSPTAAPSYPWCRRATAAPGQPTVALVGDSTALALNAGLVTFARQHRWGYVQAAANGCSILPLEFPDEPTNPIYVARAQACVVDIPKLLDAVETAVRPTIWIVSDRWMLVTLRRRDGQILPWGNPERSTIIRDALKTTLTQLTSTGAKVIYVITPPPAPPLQCAFDPHPAPACTSSTYSTSDPQTVIARKLVEKVAAQLKGRVFPVSVDNVVCPDAGHCPAEINGHLGRPDQIHYTGYLSRKLAPVIIASALRAGLDP